jgi:signal transduction histidine kinase/ActR/RegA family two-component response regulator
MWEEGYLWATLSSSMRLRTNLLYLVVGTIVPLIALATVLGLLLVERERDAVRQGAINRNRAFMTAVDAALKGHISTLQALATVSSLEKNDLETFRNDAIRVLEAQSDWQSIVLTKPDGEQLIVTSRNGSEPITHTVDVPSLQRVVNEEKPVIGELRYREYSKKYGIAIRVPVRLQGQLAFVLSAVINPEQFSRLIIDQHLPAGWVSGLVDPTGHLIARIPARPNSDRATEIFMNALKTGSEGWYRGRTLEGADTYTAFKTSEFCNWSVGLAIPIQQVNAGAVRAVWVMVAGTLITISLALGFAYWMGRRITTPIDSLADAARAMGRDSQTTPIGNSAKIKEVSDLAKALDEANVAIRERESLAEREQVALKSADRAKDEFLAMLGHELRNPLAAIAASARVLRTSNPDSSVRIRAHDVIERQTDQMTRLVDDLLNVSRLTRGKITLELEVIDLVQLTQTVIHTWEESGRIERDRIVFQGETVWVDADKARLEQVISNLIDNAAKFSKPETDIQISVGKEGNTAFLSVSDHGEGIDPTLQEQVFDLFVQGPHESDRSRGGLGLGLAVVKRIVALHAGSVSVSSGGVRQGATFLIKLPAVQPVVGSPEGLKQEQPANGFGKILVVEDNADTRDMMEAMLRIEGYDVITVDHGTLALEALADKRITVVLLDIGLPDLDGYEVARRIRALPESRRFKLVALTGYGQLNDQRRAFEAGFDEHLTKPVSIDRLSQVIRVLNERGADKT